MSCMKPQSEWLSLGFCMWCRVTAAENSGCKVHGPAWGGDCRARSSVPRMELMPGAPLQQREGSIPMWWTSPSCCVLFAPWMAAGRKEPGLMQSYRPSVQTSLRAHSKTFADTEKPDSWEAAARTAHDFSSPAGNNHPWKCSKDV